MTKQEAQRVYVVNHLAPLLESHEFKGPVLDYGCGRGGILNALAGLCDARLIGIDNNPDSIAIAKEGAVRTDVEFRVVNDYRPEGKFLKKWQYGIGVLLMCDVVEHIGTAAALVVAADLLAPGGLLYISFPPWRSPFGGHQQTCSGKVRYLPWAHLIVPHTTKHKSLATARNAEDINSVYKWRVSSRNIEEGAGDSFELVVRNKWLVRPEHMRSGLKPVRAPSWMPDYMITGAEYIMRKAALHQVQTRGGGK